MSKITKTLCDKCNKEIDYEDCYYSAQITYQSNSSKFGEGILDGDYCKDCFKKAISQRLNFKEE